MKKNFFLKFKTIAIITASLFIFACSAAKAVTFQINNQSKLPAKDIYVSIVGVNGYWDFASNTLKTNKVSQIPSITLGKLISGKIELGNNSIAGGKIFFGINKPTPVDFNGGGYTTPLPFNYPSQLFDYIEFTTGGVIDTSQVDYFAIPFKIQTNGESAGFDTSRKQIMQDMKTAFAKTKNPDAWNSLFKGEGVINPAAIGEGDPNFGTNGVLDDAIKSIKDKTSFQVMDKNGVVSTATIDKASNTINFTNGVKINLNVFDNFQVFCNDLPLATGSADDTFTNYHGALAAAILRGVFDDANNWNKTDKFTYVNDPFAKVLHADGIDHKAYAMGFDDVSGNSSSLTMGDNVEITIQDLT